MAKKSRMSVLKRQRELRKQEQRAIKKERRTQRLEDTAPGEGQVATADDLAGYGFPADEEEEAEAAE